MIGGPLKNTLCDQDHHQDHRHHLHNLYRHLRRHFYHNSIFFRKPNPVIGQNGSSQVSAKILVSEKCSVQAGLH